MKKTIGRELFIIVNKLKRYLNNMHQKNEMNIGQARIIRYLYDSEINNIIVYQNDLSNAFSIRRATISGLLEGLLLQGFVEQRISSFDKRKKIIKLTDLGHIKAREVVSVTEKFEEELRSKFSENEANILYELLEKIEAYVDGKERLEDEKLI